MNAKHIKKGIKPILTLILLFSFTVVAFPQEKQTDPVMKLREEILAVYQAKGEQGLREFFKKSKNQITNKFILDFAEAGLKERKEEWLKACEIMAEEKKDEKTLSDILFHTGEYFRLISDIKKATDYFDKALHINIKLNNMVGQGNIYLRKGIIYFYIGDKSKSIDMFDKALLFFEKADEPNGQGKAYLSKGDIYFYTGDNSRALKMYDKALTLFTNLNNSIGIGNVYLRKGSIFERINENSKAVEFFNRALSYFEITDDSVGKGEVYRGKGNIYVYSGNFPRALEVYDKALYFFEITKNALGMGNIYKNKGHIYLYTCDYTKALEMYDRALELFEKLGNPISLASIFKSKGDVYFRTGNYSKALNLYKISLQIFEKSNNTLGLGDVHWLMGDIYFSEGENEFALDKYEKALNFYKKAGNILGQGNVYLSIGDLYLGNDDYSKALEMCNMALLYFEKSEEPMGQGHVYQTQGYIYLKSGEIFKALEILKKSLAFYKRIGDIESASFSLYLKAMVLEKLSKKNEALSFFEESISYVEKVRDQTPVFEMKKSFMEKIYNQYEETVLFMLENESYEKGFKYAESMKSRVFLDQMAEGLVRLGKGLKPELKDEQENLVGRLSALSRQMQETRGKDEKKLQALKEEYRRVESQFEELLIKIRLENPLYASVNYPQPVTVLDLQTEVLKKGETLLSYFISPEKAYAFILSRENFKVKELKVNEKEINRYVGRYLSAIKESSTNDMNRFGTLLYEKLFKPLEKYLNKSKEIIIVPSGKLETIPFESLIVAKQKTGLPVYLLEKYRIKYLQSASLLSILRKHYTRKSTSKSFIGFGDPVYDYENFKQGKPEQGSMKILATESIEGIEDEIKEIHRDRYARSGGIMDRLPYSGEEIQAIARLFEKQSLKSILYLREQAAEDNAKAVNMKDYDYIHFSCHGLLNDDFQSLVLSQLPPEKSKEDGYFTLNEIMSCDYNALLVVLSACETGSGKMYKGEGVTGLTRAVMYAGTPAVLASLWKVDDIATKELMVKFYRNMLEKKMDKVEALRQAKLELIKNKRYSSPLFWSAFVMYGE